jgi:hypothetical protein
MMADAKSNIDIPIETVFAMLSYEPETGFLRWKVSRGRVAAGQIAGCTKSVNRPYVQVRLEDRIFYAHRLAWVLHTGRPIPEGREIDHRDGEPSNNRLSNLRLATPVENKRNMRPSLRNTSGATGVSWDRSKRRWVAQMSVGNRCVFLGRFTDKADAIAARQKAEREVFGEFSYSERKTA